MNLTRRWAMANHETFSIKPIKELLSVYVGDGVGWIDPFSRNSKLASITNDINPTTSASSHLSAIEFIKSFTEIKNCIFDPPYSLRQVKECYEGIGRQFTHFDSQNSVRWTEERDAIMERMPKGGIVISFGWTTTCMGMKRGYAIKEILMVSHGPAHNDTLVTVEERN